MSKNFPPVDKIFDDLDKFRDYCRFEGKTFDEAFLYQDGERSWEAYKKWQGWMRAKARNNGNSGERRFNNYDRRPNPRFENNRSN